MSRSLRVHPESIDQVKLALKRNGYPRQKDLAEELEISLSTLNNYLNGRPVDNLNFQEISEKLGQDWKAIAFLDQESAPSNSNVNPDPWKPDLDQDEAIPDVDYYVERPPIESICYQTLLRPGALVRIKAPSLMGKTLLIARVLKKLVAQQGYQTVYINLHLANHADLGNLNLLLKWFSFCVSESLGLANRLADYWYEGLSTSKMACTNYFERYLLRQVNRPVVLCLDEVDRVFPHRDVASDFLGMLRAWHEKAKMGKRLERLRLVVVHSTEVYIPLNLNESPFNVGVPIELPELTQEQILQLAQQYQLDCTASEVEQLQGLVGGHPYLIGECFNHLKFNGIGSLEKVLNNAATEAGIYRNHLRHLWQMLQQHQALADAFKDVIEASCPIPLESRSAYKLHSMGLVNLQAHQVTLRCQLYREYFQARFQETP
ncbi:AAA-like domain-containing protein [Moorena sp. SIO3I6]|uniref:AAA-like domain-containing protein n=1 Tax=Moorena sp. SIO3I6 TaxID=2607831 RepID=UPI0013FB700C|nr:AAA-like domain-containing protein [Moorena sp. SIO3I6]NEP21518.1 molecular chaperone Tir [Moorena sp. SIO3I6]